MCYWRSKLTKEIRDRGIASLRKSKKSRYIRGRLVARVEKMEAEKVPVKKILEVLISGGFSQTSLTSNFT